MFKRIKTIIVEQLSGIDESDITPETTFDSMDIDSIDAVEIIMAIEDEFDIEIEDETAETFQSIGDIMDHLNSLD